MLSEGWRPQEGTSEARCLKSREAPTRHKSNSGHAQRRQSRLTMGPTSSKVPVPLASSPFPVLSHLEGLGDGTAAHTFCVLRPWLVFGLRCLAVGRPTRLPLKGLSPELPRPGQTVIHLSQLSQNMKILRAPKRILLRAPGL